MLDLPIGVDAPRPPCGLNCCDPFFCKDFIGRLSEIPSIANSVRRLNVKPQSCQSEVIAIDSVKEFLELLLHWFAFDAGRLSASAFVERLRQSQILEQQLLLYQTYTGTYMHRYW